VLGGEGDVGHTVGARGGQQGARVEARVHVAGKALEGMTDRQTIRPL